MMFLSVSVSRISLLFLVFLQIRTFANTATNISYHNEKDYLALLDLKNKIMEDPYGIMKSWNGSAHICKWPGIVCGRRHKRVTSINLASSGLVGFLSSSLGNMSFLHELILRNNSFQGKIPSEYGNLFRLRTLRLSRNSLQGEIPGELGSLSKLKVLHIQSNNLTGRIPPSLGNLTSLYEFSVVENYLVGDIPDTFGQLKILTYLACGGNDLSGIIPPSIYNISSLSVLGLAENRLHGSLPPSLGLMLPHLQDLQLRDNHFTGPLPASLSNASELKNIEITGNRFSGKITTDFSGMQNLTFVAASENNFGSGEPGEMTFFSSLTNCSNLEVLSIRSNQLRGVLPKDIGNLSSQLWYLNLGENYIYGAIPSTIGKLISLETLSLEFSQLRGTIPSSIGSLQKLKRLALSVNKLSGKIPESIGNLTLLIELYLHQNMLEGAIPPSIGNCRNLLLLNLSQNKLSDTIPREIFEISALSISLDLSQNHLTGLLPPEIGELVNLVELDLSLNNLSGNIPESIGKCTTLSSLTLAGNFFYGSIPSSFSMLRAIQTINLSHNNLSGQIPLFLKSFTLVALDLSFNDLEGEVPTQGIFANLSVVSVVGNRGLCGGILQLQLPNCRNIEPKKHKISNVILITIVTTSCLFIGVIWLSYFLLCSSKRSNLSSTSPFQRSHLRVTYGKLFKATNGFSSENLIGMGSFGSVYKGIFSHVDGFIVAVKVINLLHGGAVKSFMHECEALREIRHRNLVKIITCCSSIDFQGNDFKALVYEFMPNGSLENWLHASRQAEEPNIHNKLDLLQRINVAVDVACALDYLHQHCQKQIIHCDMKPSNILLDSDLTAHVGDFGLAKFLPQHSIGNDSNSIGIRGSIGYVAPEYGMGIEVSPYGDAYSYGILLLEMMTGKRPTDPMFVEGLNLHKFVSMAMSDHVIDILDPILVTVDEAETTNNTCNPLQVIKGSKMEECLVSVFQVGLACSMDLPQDRMNMSAVVRKLQSIRNNILH